jgi:MoaA/NifB/PqqE/SkfB family radical SAM enzyme
MNARAASRGPLAPRAGEAAPEQDARGTSEAHVAQEPRLLPDFSLYRPRPGHPDWVRLAVEARELAGRLAPGLEPPARGMREGVRRLRAYGTAGRNWLLNRSLHRQGREDLRPLYFIWTALRTCNFRCGYCDDHRGHKYPELPLDGALDTERGVELLRVMRTGTASVYFAGGEPTLRKDLPELTRAARDLDYFPIVVNTNGSVLHRLLARHEWRGWLADVDIVVVSLDGLDLSEMGRLWVTRRPEDVLRNVLLLRELAGRMRFKLMVNTVIRPGRVHEARDVLDLANDLGLWFCPVPLNVGPAAHPALAGDPEYERLVQTILERKRAGYRISGSLRLNRRLLGFEPLDCRNTLKPHVDHDGRLMWPCKASVNVEPVPVDVLAHRSVDMLWAEARALRDPKGFHGPGPEQCGASCNWAQNYTTDAYHHGLAHPASLLREVVELLRRRA